jgi:hypothetical protein
VPHLFVERESKSEIIIIVTSNYKSHCGRLGSEVVGALVGASVILVGFPVGDAEGVILAVELLVGVTPDSLLGVLVGVLEGMPLGSTEG